MAKMPTISQSVYQVTHKETGRVKFMLHEQVMFLLQHIGFTFSDLELAFINMNMTGRDYVFSDPESSYIVACVACFGGSVGYD